MPWHLLLLSVAPHQPLERQLLDIPMQAHPGRLFKILPISSSDTAFLLGDDGRNPELCDL